MIRIRKIEASGNSIIIKNIHGSHIYVNSVDEVRRLCEDFRSEMDEIKAFLSQKQDPIFNEFIQKIYNIEQIGVLSVDNVETLNVASAGQLIIQQALKKVPKFITNPATNSNFRDHEDTLETLSQKLNNKKQVALIGINGIGGIGKTYIASEFIKRNQEDYDHILWLDFEGSLSKSLINKLLLKNLEVELLPNINETLEIIKNKLENLDGKKLFILDNVTNISDFYSEMYLLPTNTWQILCTARTNDIEEFESIKIRTLSLEESRLLFCDYYFNTNSLGISSSDIYTKLSPIEVASLDELLNSRLDLHTLSVTLVAKTGYSSGLSILELNEILKLENLDTTLFQEQIYAQYDTQQRKMFAVLLKAFSISGIQDDQLSLLKHFSIFPSSPLDLQDLKEVLSGTFPALGSLIKEINKKGWLEKSVHLDTTYSVSYRFHPILQEMIRIQDMITFAQVKKLINELISIHEHDEFGFEKKNLEFIVLISESIANYFPSHSKTAYLYYYSSLYYKQTSQKKIQQVLLNIALEIFEKKKDKIGGLFCELEISDIIRKYNLPNNYRRIAEIELDIKQLDKFIPINDFISKKKIATMFSKLGDYYQENNLYKAFIYNKKYHDDIRDLQGKLNSDLFRIHLAFANQKLVRLYLTTSDQLNEVERCLTEMKQLISGPNYFDNAKIQMWSLYFEAEAEVWLSKNNMLKAIDSYLQSANEISLLIEKMNDRYALSVELSEKYFKIANYYFLLNKYKKSKEYLVLSYQPLKKILEINRSIPQDNEETMQAIELSLMYMDLRPFFLLNGFIHFSLRIKKWLFRRDKNFDIYYINIAGQPTSRDEDIDETGYIDFSERIEFFARFFGGILLIFSLITFNAKNFEKKLDKRFDKVKKKYGLMD